MTSIAIDGPAGAGKSTLARQLASALGYLYIDTGALYRTVGLHSVRTAGGYSDPAAVVASLSSCNIEMKLADGKQLILLDGAPVGDDIRTPEISMAASAVSAVPEVRAFLLELQRNAAKTQNIVMDGRDIGTVVLPDASIKIFLTASPNARAKRRYDELIAKGTQVSYEEVYNDLVTRDRNDSTRKIAPLKPARDSVTADTTELDLKQSFDLLMRIVSEKQAVSKRKKRRERRKMKRAVPAVKHQRIIQILLGWLARLIFRIKVTGRENLPKSGPLVLCCNHLHVIDPVLIAFCFNRPINFIAKKSLFEKPFPRLIMNWLGAFPVDRERANMELFRTVESVLDLDRVIGIFPEGHRGSGSTMAEGKAGVGMIVLRNGVSVLPAAIKYPKKAGFLRRTLISFGEVIQPEAFASETGKQRYQLCADRIMEKISALSEELK